MQHFKHPKSLRFCDFYVASYTTYFELNFARWCNTVLSTPGIFSYLFETYKCAFEFSKIKIKWA
jgi:hypothetical protein